MDTARGLQEVVTRNVRVLMAIHGITTQRDLAARIGWDEPKLAKRLRGDRRWALEDLPVIADVLGVPPSALLGDTTELVGLAAHPAAVGDGVRKGVRLSYPRPKHGVVVPFPQVNASAESYASRPVTLTARSIAARRHRHLRTVDALSGISLAPVTRVTSVVGL